MDPSDRDTLVFEMEITCGHNPDARKHMEEQRKSKIDQLDEQYQYVNSSVYSSTLVWSPQGDQVRQSDNHHEPWLNSQSREQRLSQSAMSDPFMMTSC